MSRIRVRNWFMLADKKTMENNQNQTESITTEPDITPNTFTIDSELDDNSTNRNNNTNKNNNNNNIPTLTEDEIAAAITNDSNEADVVIKLERSTPSPPPSLLLNNLSDFSCDFDDEDEESCSEEFDGSTPSDLGNYDIKLSSPISWALQPIKVESIDDEFDIPIIQTAQFMNNPSTNLGSGIQKISTIQINSKPQQQDQETQIGCGNKTASAIASAFAAIANTTASIKKSTTTLVPTKQMNRTNTSESLLKLFSTNAITSNDLNEKKSTLLTILPTVSQEQYQNNAALIPHGTSIRLVHKLENNNSTQTINKTTSTMSTVTTTSVAPASVIGPDDKKYRILYQNQRIRKESLEHSDDMIYKGMEVEKPWTCKNCNRDYKWKNSLKCHLKNECGQPPRYFCKKMCGYRTNVHSNLKRHMNTKCKDDDGMTLTIAENNGNNNGNSSSEAININ